MELNVKELIKLANERGISGKTQIALINLKLTVYDKTSTLMFTDMLFRRATEQDIIQFTMFADFILYELEDAQQLLKEQFRDHELETLKTYHNLKKYKFGQEPLQLTHDTEQKLQELNTELLISTVALETCVDKVIYDRKPDIDKIIKKYGITIPREELIMFMNDVGINFD